MISLVIFSQDAKGSMLNSGRGNDGGAYYCATGSVLNDSED